MNKRILSVVLSLIMLISLVPAGALTASAAGLSVSENAITVLKQLEGYSKYCEKGYTGYGTLCTKSGDHDDHITSEKEADTALRSELKDLSAAVNSFASKNGLSLSQSKHDALVLFSFENGTAWTTGSGDFQTAIKSGITGSDFLTAICWWDNSLDDDDRRMIEANMYLNGVYSSYVPTRFIRVRYDANGGTMPEAEYQYYDTNLKPVPDIVPSRYGYKFMGWYTLADNGVQVTSLKTSHDGDTLYAYWQVDDNEPEVDGITNVEQNVLYYRQKTSKVKLYTYVNFPIIEENEKDEDNQVAVYKYSDSDKVVGHITRGERITENYKDTEPENGRSYVKYGDVKGWVNSDYITYERDFSESGLSAKGNLLITKEYIDSDGERWGLVEEVDKLYNKDGDKIDAYGDEIVEDDSEDLEEPTQTKTEAVSLDYFGELWMKLGEASFNDGTSNSGSSADSYSIDVTVTVTNSYLRIRSSSSASSAEVGRLSMGDQVRIVNTATSNGALWGQIADTDGDGKCEGWISLVYTNYESVKGNSQPVVSYNVIATATVVSPVNGYVNVRSGAGTDNQIVGALSYQSRVELYEITYVNGIQWGRYSGGWFCLAYANVNGVNVDDYNTNANVLAYAFTGKLLTKSEIFVSPSDDAAYAEFDSIKTSNRTITNLTADAEGNTWGKISEGWVKVTDYNGNAANMQLDVAKYYTVVDGVTVRTEPSTSAERVNNLVKGVEFNVNEEYQIMVIGDTIWGYADKVGEGNKTYSGWINLASKYVARGDAPASGEASSSTGSDDEDTGLIGTIIGADKVNVRIHHATYSKILGKIARGTVVKILDEEDGWYKIDYDVDNDPETDSWVVNTYVQVTEATTGTGSSSTGSTTGSSTGSAAVETGLGIVANTYTGVNVRTAPGTGNAAVGKLLAGSAVEILEVTTYGASKWGRVAQGWICMDYVTMVDNYEILGAIIGNTGSTGTTGSNAATSTEVAIYTGSIASGTVEIHKTTSLNSDVVREVSAGDPITLHEIVTVTEEVTSSTEDSSTGSTTTTTKTTSYWGRVNDGYIYNPADNLDLDTLDEHTYTVTESNTLNVRNNPGTSGTSVLFKLAKGDQVTITRLDIVNGNVWGYVECDDGEGWASLAYMTKGAVTIQTESSTNNTTSNNTTTGSSGVVIGAGSSTGGYVTNTSGYRYTGKVINTDSVNVRATASTTASITTTLKKGASLVIYETTIADNMAWGRCDAGWVYLYYVDLTPVVGGAVDARVVYNDNTIAYSDMNMSEATGTYSKMSVVDIYEIVGKMARTELGWVNTDNLL